MQYLGCAREKINIIPSSIKFDLIYLDGFSPSKCPQVWTIEFLSKVTEKLNSGLFNNLFFLSGSKKNFKKSWIRDFHY